MTEKKRKRRPRAGDYCRSKTSGRLFRVTKVSPARGWFKLNDHPGWYHWGNFHPVPEDEALEELKNESAAR